MQARVTDTGRPLGHPFQVGELVYYRPAGLLCAIPVRHVLRPVRSEGRAGARRWVSINQLDGATDRHQPCPGHIQEICTRLWDSLEPKHAGFLDPYRLIPRRQDGIDVVLMGRNPEVDGVGWQMDTTVLLGAPPFMVLAVEKQFWINSPKRPPPEQAVRDVRESIRNEIEELDIKGDLVDERWPNISNADREVCMDEMEGIAHTLTIDRVDGFRGKDADIRYLRESFYPMLVRWGYKGRADQERATDEEGQGVKR
jgi:hypothetical protein